MTGAHYAPCESAARTSCARTLHRRSDAEIEAAWSAMRATAAIFGQPHLHSGRGIRQLRPGLYECRSGLGLRLVFEREKDAVVFVFSGSHDEVQDFLRDR